jgi:hypothetical protein
MAAKNNPEAAYAERFAAITKRQVAEAGRADWALASQLVVHQLIAESFASEDYAAAALLLHTHDSPAAWRPRPPADGTQELAVRLSRALERRGEIPSAIDLWARLVTSRRAHLMQNLRPLCSKKKVTEAWVREMTPIVLDCSDCLLSALGELESLLAKRGGPHDELERVRAEIAAVEGIRGMLSAGADRTAVAASGLLDTLGKSERPARAAEPPDRGDMDANAFWKLVGDAAASKGPPADQARFLVARLEAHPPDQIVAFHKLLYGFLAEAYRRDLWAAASLLMGDCSDDSFEYFRAWLVLQGPGRFVAALENPDSIADWADAGMTFQAEEILDVAREAYRRVKGSELPRAADGAKAKLRGRKWRPEDWPGLLPKLHAKFG